MPIQLSELTKYLRPEKTVLFFGAGSSLTSGAPQASVLIEKINSDFSVNNPSLSLSEISGIVEKRVGRSKLIENIRRYFPNLKPMGGMSNLPIYSWKSIYTTNYDEIIEKSYASHKKQ